MDTKSLRVEVKDDEKGQVTATFATFNAVDSDKDVTRPGAFTDGAEVVISSYGHSSWDGVLPVGKGVIRQTAKEARLDGQFFMDIPEAASTFKAVKALGSLGQWSYGYDPVEYSFGDFKGQNVRFLDSVKVFEVSPVLVGAGVGVRTLSAKSADRDGRRGRKAGALAPHETTVVTRSWDGAGMLAALAKDARPSELRSVHAWCDPDGDPEAKSSYAYPHHHGVDGPANVRACLAAIALLNGPKGASLDGPDREAVHAHLAGHLRDADVDVPQLRDGGAGELKYLDEGHAVMAAVNAYIDRSAEVVALRKSKGRGISPKSAELLTWLAEDLGRLKSLLSTPTGEDDPTEADLASLYARSLALVHEI